MKIHLFAKVILVSAATALLCACNGFFDKDNTPTPTALKNFKEEARPRKLWETSVNAGIGSDYIKLIPAIGGTNIFTADKNGVVTATNKANGATRWQRSTDTAITAGPAVNNGYVYVGTRRGTVIALHETDGSIAWKTAVPSEVLSPPAASNGVVLVKTIDGQLTALSETDGHKLWHYQQTEPLLILHTGSAPQIYRNSTVVGFANGNISKLSLQEGSLIWQQTVAIPTGTFAIQRMVDIDADPVIFDDTVYVATYQGRIAALNIATSAPLWMHDISSFTGISVDSARVYVSDATSQIWAFDTANGNVTWHQTQLEARNISGPANMGNTVVVGDAEGYLHWLSKQDGHFVARAYLGSAGILATPAVENNIAYVLTKDGHLVAYTLT